MSSRHGPDPSVSALSETPVAARARPFQRKPGSSSTVCGRWCGREACTNALEETESGSAMIILEDQIRHSWLSTLLTWSGRRRLVAKRHAPP